MSRLHYPAPAGPITPTTDPFGQHPAAGLLDDNEKPLTSPITGPFYGPEGSPGLYAADGNVVYSLTPDPEPDLTEAVKTATDRRLAGLLDLHVVQVAALIPAKGKTPSKVTVNLDGTQRTGRWLLAASPLAVGEWVAVLTHGQAGVFILGPPAP